MRARDPQWCDQDDALARPLICAPGELGLDDVLERVAGAVAQVEPASEREGWRQRFAQRLHSRSFLPALPVLLNAGRDGQLAACFVLEPEDDLASIYRALGTAAQIQQGCGGTGIHLSRLRPRGETIRRSGGTSPGPVAFAELFARSAQVNRRAGRRPGAHLAVLHDDHPDALEFVRAKSASPGAFAGVGTAIGLHDTSLDRAGAAGALLDEICQSIWEIGEPSLLFLDAIEAANPLPELGPLEATNPCGEQPLRPGESCVLGSLQLPVFLRAGALDWDELGRAVDDAVRFLDDVIDTNRFPEAELARESARTRKIGLGVMGLADVLLVRGVEYASPAALAWVEETLGFVAQRARAASEQLAGERGAFPAWDAGGTPRRNATQLAVAPTGTLCLLAGCSAGIEPFLRPVFELRVGAGREMWRDCWLSDWADAHAADPAVLLEALRRELPWTALPGVKPEARALLKRAWEIDPGAQIALQAAVQAHVDGAVSKTVHLPETSTPAEILGWIRAARAGGCKGVAFFRRGCAAAAESPGELELSLPGP